MVTIKDVAQRCGVSPSTVSIVLNGHAAQRHIPLETVERVQEAVAALHYSRNVYARSLRTSASKTVLALFWALDERSSFFMRIVRGVNRAMENQPFPCEMVIHPFRNGELQREREHLFSDVYSGLLIGALSGEDQQLLEGLDLPAPVYLLNRKSQRYPCCYADPAQIGAQAARYAADLGAHCAAVITSRSADYPKLVRRDAAIAAFEQVGISCPETLRMRIENSPAAGFDAARALLCGQGDVPDVAFVGTDLMSVGFSLGCQAMGRTDFPLISIHLSQGPAFTHLSPQPLTIDIPGEDIGEYAARQMLSLLQQGTPMESRMMPCCTMYGAEAVDGKHVPMLHALSGESICGTKQSSSPSSRR